jgi:hypothetical protein
MRKITNFEISKESIEDMCAAGRHNPCLEITYRDSRRKQTHKLKAGYDDDIHVYREGLVTFVLTENHRLGYVGLEAFDYSGHINSVFFQDYDEMELSPITKIRRFRELVLG